MDLKCGAYGYQLELVVLGFGRKADIFGTHLSFLRIYLSDNINKGGIEASTELKDVH